MFFCHVLLRSLSKLMDDRADDWGKFLDAAVFSINTSIQCTTKVTPFRMMFGREPRFPLEVESACEPASEQDFTEMLQTVDAEVFLEKLIEKQDEVFKTVDKRIQEAQKKQKEQYKKRKGIVDYKFKIGDKVLRRNMQQKTRKGSKREDRWLGPFIIVELTTTCCSLKNIQGKLLKTRINLSQLKPYFQQDQCSSFFDEDHDHDQDSTHSDDSMQYDHSPNGQASPTLLSYQTSAPPLNDQCSPCPSGNQVSPPPLYSQASCLSQPRATAKLQAPWNRDKQGYVYMIAWTMCCGDQMYYYLTPPLLNNYSGREDISMIHPQKKLKLRKKRIPDEHHCTHESTFGSTLLPLSTSHGAISLEGELYCYYHYN